MKDETIEVYIKALRYASQHGLLFEFCKSFLDDVTVASHIGDQEIIDSIVFANREWDL